MDFLLLDSSGDFLLLDSSGDMLLLGGTTPAATNPKGWFWWEAERLKRDEEDVIQTVITVLTNLL